MCGDYEIYELDISSGYLKQITDNDTNDVDVTLSRDGRTIAWQKCLPDNRQAMELRRMEESGEYTSITDDGNKVGWSERVSQLTEQYSGAFMLQQITRVLLFLVTLSLFAPAPYQRLPHYSLRGGIKLLEMVLIA